MKGNGEESWCVVNGIIACVQEIERVREGVVILSKDVRHIMMIDFGSVSSRILWVKFCMVVGYGLNEGIGRPECMG